MRRHGEEMGDDLSEAESQSKGCLPDISKA